MWWLVGVLLFLLLVLVYMYREAYALKLIYLYKKTCPYCVTFDTEWDKISKYAWGFKKVKIDAESERGLVLMENFGLTTVPSVVCVDYMGARALFLGERTSENIKEFVDKLL
jgi:glutaredoxin